MPSPNLGKIERIDDLRTIFNEAANAYFRQYLAYQKANYPELNLRTKETSNGWWAEYNTVFGNAYILHKTQEGYADLTFKNAGKQTELVREMADWLRKHDVTGVHGEKTNNAAVLRIDVPKLKVKEPFEQTDEKDLKVCFDAIRELNNLARFLNTSMTVKQITERKSKQ